MLTDLLIDGFNNGFDLKVGFKCNSRCIHCFISDRGEASLSFQNIKEIIDKNNQKYLVNVTGGEPTIRDDIIDILSYAKSRNLKIILQTNGRKFYEKSFAKEVSKLVDIVVIPIHSFNSKAFDKITSVIGSYNETIEGLKNLSPKTHIMTQTVINQYNYESLPETFDFIQNLEPKIEKMLLTFPHPVGAASTKDVVPSYIETFPYIQKAAGKHAKKMITHYIPLCYLYPHQNEIFVIDKNELGDKNLHGLDYINDEWQDVNYGKQSDGKIKSFKCKKCIFDNVCNGIWKEYRELYDFDKDVKPIKR